jgi:hypothetical protein
MTSCSSSSSSSSSSWPWMKDVAIAIADPIAPVTEHDIRESVKDLIQKHRDKIDKVQEGIQSDPLYDATKHDDLWIVRFLLSHGKKAKPSIKAAKATLEFRDKYKLDDEDLRGYPFTKELLTVNGPTHSTNKLLEDMKKWFQALDHGTTTYAIPDPQRGVIAFINMGSFDQNRLMEHVDEEAHMGGFIFLSEWSHQWLDYVTRTTGRLTKAVRLLDVEEYNMSKMNRVCTQRDGKCAGAMEDCYPQLLASFYVCNPPFWVHIPWKIVRPFLPKRVASKVDFISPKQNEKERKRLLAYVSEEQLATRFGGTHDHWPVQFSNPTV